MNQMKIPKEVQIVLDRLQNAGFGSYIVGGCVRDLLRGVDPQDWDVTTNAEPQETQRIFPKSFYANKFGTVTVEAGKTAREIEITTYRVEEKYTDKRHPDKVRFAKTIEEDLARRDFTINAMALGIKSQIPKSKLQTNSKFKILNSKPILIDLFNGGEDLRNKIIRAVGSSEERFSEDALRMMRAARFAATLDFVIEKETFEAIKKHAGLLNFISKERVRDEFVKILEASKAEEGITLLEESGLLKHIAPELREGIGVSQNKHHIYTVWEHNLKSLAWAAKSGYNLDVRLASLFHDIGKPKTKEGDGPDSTFYGHQVVSAKMAACIMERLRFPRKQIEKVAMLVRNHMFVYNVGEVTERSVRRLVTKVGLENMDDLVNLRIADRKGSGVPKAQPYRLRHFQYIVGKVSRDPITPKMLKMDGDEIMKLLGIEPGPKVGEILAVLLDEVLDDPKRNTRKYLRVRVKELGELAGKEVSRLAYEARRRIEEVGESIEEQHKKKYWVT